MIRRPPSSPLFPYPPLFRSSLRSIQATNNRYARLRSCALTASSHSGASADDLFGHPRGLAVLFASEMWERFSYFGNGALVVDRKSTRLNSSHSQISYAVFCL